MDINEIKQKSEKEVADLNQKKAVLEAKIKEKAARLGLDLSKPLAAQVNAKVKELKEEMADKEATIESLTQQLEELNDVNGNSEQSN